MWLQLQFAVVAVAVLIVLIISCVCVAWAMYSTMIILRRRCSDVVSGVRLLDRVYTGAYY